MAKRIVGLVAVAAAFLAVSLSASANVPFNDSGDVVETPAVKLKLKIISAEVRFANDAPARLFVKGKNFGNVVTALKLGDIDLTSNVTLWTDTMIEADLLSHSIVPATYVVKVRRGTAPLFRDEIDVTIGTTGPEGPPGTNGEDGAPGPPGTAPFLGLSCPEGEALIGFDATGQLLCGEFISDPTAIGPWPQFQSVTATANPSATASCDMTDFFITVRGLCGRGPQLQGPLILTSMYTQVRVETKVIDPQSNPLRDEIELVSFRAFSGPFLRINHSLLHDDGSAVSIPLLQRHHQAIDCSVAGDDDQSPCTCKTLFHELESGDTTSSDDVFTSSFGAGVVNFTSSIEQGLFQDCIAIGNRHVSFFNSNADNTELQFEVRAIDHAGNVSVLPLADRPEISFGDNTLECSGDPCGCPPVLDDVEVDRVALALLSKEGHVRSYFPTTRGFLSSRLRPLPGALNSAPVAPFGRTGL